MFQYLIRRLLISIPILLIGSFLLFLLVASAGDPLAGLKGKPGVTPEQIHTLSVSLGLDKPILARYWSWLTGFVTGNWGVSVALGEAQTPVIDTISNALWVTMRLVIGAELIALVLGIAVGVFSAVRQYSIFDYIATSIAFLMFSMPISCVAVVIKNYGIQFNNVLESFHLKRWLTTAGPPTSGFGHNLGQIIVNYSGTFLLPTISLMTISFAAYSRFQRASMLETLNADYVRTARAKGLSQSRVIFRHAMRNALIPVTTLFALNIGAIIGGAIITEHVFGWSGMGTVLVKSVTNFDPPTLMGWFAVTATVVVVFNLIADVLYGLLDPRIRLG
ncbi:ABC transporter permease [Kutzneria kofuensis]|uniref:Peptide/nickel transport system permease protein n=1 Tax=Kutzneria kofuensis TaxID=103725 RepID=A0A7W9KFV9_9PSEU|nr:ABC transporter permease [Kutzneria kofuensis]MBB5891687.1 peptide/nickel transport system permease protein [Kutzneria kofuensis]